MICDTVSSFQCKVSKVRRRDWTRDPTSCQIARSSLMWESSGHLFHHCFTLLVSVCVLLGIWNPGEVKERRGEKIKGEKRRGEEWKGEEKRTESERRSQLMDRRRETGEGKSRSLRKIGRVHNVPIVLSFSFQYLTLPLFLPPFHFLSIWKRSASTRFSSCDYFAILFTVPSTPLYLTHCISFFLLLSH